MRDQSGPIQNLYGGCCSRMIHCCRRASHAPQASQTSWCSPAMHLTTFNGGGSSPLSERQASQATRHSNRHTFRSRLAMSGTTRKEIRELAGHKAIQMSARYAHLNPAHKLAAVERIAKPATRKPPEPDERSDSHRNSHQTKRAKAGRGISIKYS